MLVGRQLEREKVTASLWCCLLYDQHNCTNSAIRVSKFTSMTHCGNNRFRNERGKHILLKFPHILPSGGNSYPNWPVISQTSADSGNVSPILSPLGEYSGIRIVSSTS